MEKENSIKIVEKFNKENRYRDCGRINNAIDNVIEKAKSSDIWKHLYRQLEKDFEDYKKGKDKFNAIKSKNRKRRSNGWRYGEK